MELQENYDAFQALDAEIIGIAQLEKDPAMLSRIESFVGDTFPIVADPEQVTRRPFKIFGVYLVDKEGTLRTFIPGTKEARPRLDLILSELAKLEGKTAPEVRLLDGKAVVQREAADTKRDEQEPVVSARWMLSHNVVRPGDEFKIAFLPLVRRGYQVYGPDETSMTPLKVSLKLPAHLSLLEPLRYPVPKKKTDDALGVELDYYENDIPLSALSLRAAADVEPGRLEILAELQYQACDATRCLPPSKQTVRLTVPVVPAGTERGQVFGWQTW